MKKNVINFLILSITYGVLGYFFDKSHSLLYYLTSSIAFGIGMSLFFHFQQRHSQKTKNQVEK